MRAADGTVLKQQGGVVRTNCMDNLDRTNVVQSLFARQAALAAIPGAMEKTKASGSNVLTSPFPDFEHAFNNLWADNADAISFLYSGTGALKTDFTRTGKRTAMGALQDGVNSLSRYVLNNFNDGRMQDAWDLFLGRYVPKRGSRESVSAIEAHMNEMSPQSFFLNTLMLFASLTAAVAYFATSHTDPLSSRLAWGAAGATLVLGGVAFMLIKKGHGLGKRLVNRPRLMTSYAHGGRDKEVVGGLHSREPTDIAVGTKTGGVGGAGSTASSLDDTSQRAKLA